MKKNMKKGKLLLLIFLLFGTIIVLALTSEYAIASLNRNSENITKTVENQWRILVKENLKEVERHMMDDIHNGELDVWDDHQLKNWISRNKILFEFTDYEQNVAVVNIGYSFSKWDEDVSKKVFEENKVSSKIQKDITDLCSNFISTGKNNTQMYYELSQLSKEIANKNNVSERDIFSLLKQIFFKKENTIISAPKPMSTNSNHDNTFYKQFLQEYMKTDSSNITLTDTKGNSEWIEWVMIPDGKLGFNYQTQFNENGDNNYGYKKLLILVSLDTNKILQPFSSIHNDITSLKAAIILILIMAIVLSVIIISFRFNIYKGGAYCDSECIRHNNDYSDELFNIIHNKFKQDGER